MSSQLPENVENRLLISDLIGYAIPVAGTIVFFGIAYYIRDSSHLAYEIFRDIGIAFLVAVVVTLIYEFYARRHYERKKFINTLQVIMNEIVHPGVWEEVRNQIIEKSMIREGNQITLTLEEQEGLTNGQMVLCLEYEYAIRSLRSKPGPVKILHYLDNHIECKQCDLPRFEKIEIGKKDYSADIRSRIDNGVISIGHTLKARDKAPVRVRTRRKEITYVPGSYNLIMGEICEGLTIKLDQIPAGIVAYVHVWPHTEKPILLEQDKTLESFIDKILLPGQGCEFRFTPKTFAANRPNLVITAPSDDGKVGDSGWVEGNAMLPNNTYLWVLLGVSALPDRWWPQGPGVEITEDGSWQVRVFYGRQGEIGKFRIAAIVVDRKTNKRLHKWYAAAVTTGNYGSIELPQPFDVYLSKTLTVEKTKGQLTPLRKVNELSKSERRSTMERRIKASAVSHERRAMLDRRKAS